MDVLSEIREAEKKISYFGVSKEGTIFLRLHRKTL